MPLQETIVIKSLVCISPINSGYHKAKKYPFLPPLFKIIIDLGTYFYCFCATRTHSQPLTICSSFYNLQQLLSLTILLPLLAQTEYIRANKNIPSIDKLYLLIQNSKHAAFCWKFYTFQKKPQISLILFASQTTKKKCLVDNFRHK